MFGDRFESKPLACWDVRDRDNVLRTQRITASFVRVFSGRGVFKRMSQSRPGCKPFKTLTLCGCHSLASEPTWTLRTRSRHDRIFLFLDGKKRPAVTSLYRPGVPSTWVCVGGQGVSISIVVFVRPPTSCHVYGVCSLAILPAHRFLSFFFFDKDSDSLTTRHDTNKGRSIDRRGIEY